MTVKFFLIFLIFFTYLVNAVAGDEQNTPYGIGLDSCSGYTEAPKRDRDIYLSWVAGYLSSREAFIPKTNILGKKGVLSADRVEIWLEFYCAQYPEHTFSDATNQLIRRFYRKTNTE
jgi:hypothetical protein